MGEATYEVENNDVTVECWHACREGNITQYWTIQIPPDYGNFTLLYNNSTLLDKFIRDHNLMASISTTDKCHEEDRVYYSLKVDCKDNEACLNNSGVLCGVILNDRNFTSSKISNYTLRESVTSRQCQPSKLVNRLESLILSELANKM